MNAGSTPPTCACDTGAVLITLSGGSYSEQSIRSGDYIKMEGTVVNGRSVYESRDSSYYLYFWAPYAAWLVGSDYNDGASGITSADENSDASCPESANTWGYYSGDEWRNGDGEISIACSPLTARSPPL